MTNTTTTTDPLISDATAKAIRDLIKTTAHWAEQEHRNRTGADRCTRLLDTTADELRRHHLATRVRTHTTRADESAEAVRVKRESLAALLTVTVALPGGFCNYFDGTGLAQGQDDGDPECKITREAYEDGTIRRYGLHAYTTTITTSSLTVLNILEEYTEYCLDSNADDPDPSEVKAARKAAERIQAARRELRALQALAREEQERDDAHRAADAAHLAAYSETLLATVAQEAPAPAEGPQEAPTAPQEAPTAAEAQEGPQEAQEAPTGPVLADWERDLLAAADTLPAVDREPSADQNIAQGDDPQGPQERPAADIVVPVGTTVTVTQRGQKFTGIVETAGPLRAATIAHAKRGIRTHRVGIRVPGRVGFIWADSHETTPTA